MRLPSGRTYRVATAILAYNEARKLEVELARFAPGHTDEVLLIDDGSDDGTPDVGRRLGATVITHPRRRGSGAALLTAARYALGKGCDVLTIMAGNDKDRPEEIPALVAKIDEGWDFVIGSRYLGGGRYENMPAYRVWATRWLHPWVVRLTTGRWLTDTSTGFRAIRASLLRDPRVRLDQEWLREYDGEMYVLYQALALGYRVTEVPASKIYPSWHDGYTKMKPVSGWWKMLRPFVYLRLGIKG